MNVQERKDPREMVQLKRKSDRQTMRQMFPADLGELMLRIDPHEFTSDVV